MRDNYTVSSSNPMIMTRRRCGKNHHATNIICVSEALNGKFTESRCEVAIRFRLGDSRPEVIDIWAALNHELGIAQIL